MNGKTLSLLSLTLTALVAGNALAADASTGKTRDQVRAELAEAQRTGDIVIKVGSNFVKANELYPNQYPAKPVTEGKTRAQVLTELAEAQRTGDIVIKVGSNYVKANDVNSLSFN